MAIKQTVPGDRGQFYIICKDDEIPGSIFRRLLVTHRVRHHCCFPGIFDHLIHPGMRAQKAITKRQRMRTWLRPLLWAFRKMIHTDRLHLAVWRAAVLRRFVVLFSHGSNPYTKQTERLDDLLCSV
jgi:hypothetical protein